MRILLANAAGTQWEIIVVLGGLYGLRLGEILGLRWRNADLENNCFRVVEQLPFKLPSGTTEITEMAPVKSSERTLPITAVTKPCFEQALAKRLMEASGQVYHDNDLVIARPDGSPENKTCISANLGQMLRRPGMPHIRFHDTRHTAAANMHQLTGDFYTAGEILGHSLKGISIHLHISNNMEAVTAQYVSVRMARKLIVLNTYHQAVLGGGIINQNHPLNGWFEQAL